MEGVGKKGTNNVSSLVMKTLKDASMLPDNDTGGELVIIFDNCLGQNKNSTVLKLLVYLTECDFPIKLHLFSSLWDTQIMQLTDF